MATLSSTIRIEIEGVVIKRDCIIVLGDPKKHLVKQVLVKPAWKESKLPPEDITDVLFEIMGHDEYNQLKKVVARSVERFGTDSDSD